MFSKKIYERFNNWLTRLYTDSTQISTAVPERKVVFRGNTIEGAHAMSFDVSPRIVYPMEGGTALITFEEKDGM